MHGMKAKGQLAAICTVPVLMTSWDATRNPNPALEGVKFSVGSVTET